MPMPPPWRRRRGDRQSLLPGERHDPVRRGSGDARPETRGHHLVGRHPGAAGCQERGREEARSRRRTNASGTLHPLRHQEPGRAKDAREVRAGRHAHGAARIRYPFVELVVVYTLDQGIPGVHVGGISKHKTDVSPSLPPSVQSLAKASVGRLSGTPLQPDNPEQYQQWYIRPGIA